MQYSDFNFSFMQIIFNFVAIITPLFLFISSAIYSLTIPVSVMLFLLIICLLISNRIKANWPAMAANTIMIIILTAFSYNFNYFTYPDPSVAIWIIFTLGLLPIVLISIKLFFLNKIWKTSLSSDCLLIFISSIMPYILVISVLSANEKNIIDVNNILSFVLILNVLIGLFSFIYKKGTPMFIAFTLTCFIQAVYISFYFGYRNDHFAISNSYVIWTLLIFVFFAIYPFVFRKIFIEKIGMWIVSAISGVFACLFIYITIESTHMYKMYYSLFPFGFFLFYLMLSMRIFKWQDLSVGIQRSRFSLFAGTTLFFFISIFTMQYFKYWFAFALSLEGLALVLLNLKLKHRGLLITAFSLYLIVFITLFTLFVGEHVYFIFFVIAGASMFIGAKYWSNQKDKVLVKILYPMGGLTFFLFLQNQIMNWTIINKILLGFLYCIIYFALGILAKSKNLVLIGIVMISWFTIKFVCFDIWVLPVLYKILETLAIAGIFMIGHFCNKRLKNITNETNR